MILLSSEKCKYGVEYGASRSESIDAEVRDSIFGLAQLWYISCNRCSKSIAITISSCKCIEATLLTYLFSQRKRPNKIRATIFGAQIFLWINICSYIQAFTGRVNFIPSKSNRAHSSGVHRVHCSVSEPGLQFGSRNLPAIVDKHM